VVAPRRRRRKRRSFKLNDKTKRLLLGAAALCLLALIVVLSIRFYQPVREKQIYPLEYKDELCAAAEEFSLDPCLVAGLVYCESTFRPDAISRVGAVGLGQIMPETGQWLAEKLGIEDYDEEMLTDPQINLRMCCWYLRFLLDRYDGRQQEALTAYNAGQGQVDKWLADPELSADGKTLDEIPGVEAKEYAAKVMKMYEKYCEIYGDVLGRADDADGADGLQRVRRI